MKNKKTKQTCRQALEAQGVRIFPSVDCEFIAYKPAKDGVTDMNFDLEGALEALDFYDYEEIALGRGLYVMGDVDSGA